MTDDNDMTRKVKEFYFPDDPGQFHDLELGCEAQDDERGTLIIGPWNNIPDALQRAIAEAVDWLATPYAVETDAPYFEVSLFGGRVSLCANRHASWITLQTNVARRVLDWMEARAWRLW